MFLFLTFSIFSISSHYSHSFILNTPAVFLFALLLLPIPSCAEYFKYCSFLTLSSSLPLSQLCLHHYLHSSSCCHLLWAAVQTKRKGDQRLPLLSKATKIKEWIYQQSLPLTCGCTMHTDWKNPIKHLYRNSGSQEL